MDNSNSHSLRIFAAHKWQKTNVSVKKNSDYLIHVVANGTWHLNPNWGGNERYVDGDGNSKYKASSGFMLPGVNEGALIGRVGANVFFLGKDGFVPKGNYGELELCCNDSNGGSGFKDNKGYLTVTISKSQTQF